MGAFQNLKWITHLLVFTAPCSIAFISGSLEEVIAFVIHWAILRNARNIHSTVTDKLPSPSIVTTITSPFTIGLTPAGVPDCMISPDASSKYWLR